MHIASTYILPVVTWLLGVVSSILVVWYTSRSTLRREHDLKAIERREARVIRRNEFQRENLLALQEVGQELLDTTDRIYQFRISHSLTTTLPESLPADIASPLITLTSKALMVQVRLRDEETQGFILKLIEHCDKVRDLKDRIKVEAEKENVLKSLVDLNDRVGKVLTELDALDDQVG